MFDLNNKNNSIYIVYNEVIKNEAINLLINIKYVTN